MSRTKSETYRNFVIYQDTNNGNRFTVVTSRGEFSATRIDKARKFIDNYLAVFGAKPSYIHYNPTTGKASLVTRSDDE